MPDCWERLWSWYYDRCFLPTSAIGTVRLACVPRGMHQSNTSDHVPTKIFSFGVSRLPGKIIAFESFFFFLMMPTTPTAPKRGHRVDTIEAL